MEKSIKPNNTHIIVIGAGLTGLTLAFYLKKKGADFLVLEKEERSGGVIKTCREKGFVYEAGPNTGVLSNMETHALFEHLKPHCAIEVANPEAKRRLIWKHGTWHALPANLMEAIRTPLFDTKDKMRLLLEPFRPKGKNPMETVAQLVRRRMGNSFLDYAVDPFISGIYAGDPSVLITKYALPKLYRLEQKYGSFIRGAIGKKMTERSPQPTKEVFSVAGGLGNLVSGLEKGIGEKFLIHRARQLTVQRTDNGYLVSYEIKGRTTRINAKVVISTIGSHSLANVFPFIKENDLQHLTMLDYAPVVQTVLGFGCWKGMPLNAFGGLVPSIEKRRILGILFPSSFLSGRAPAPGALLNVFLGGIRNPSCYNLPDQELMSIVEEEVSEMMHLPSFQPDLVRIFRYRYAIPQYAVDSLKRLETIVRLQVRHPGLFLAGNIQEGIGMADRVAQARRLAELINHET